MENIDNLIISRLGERRRKLDIIAEEARAARPIETRKLAPKPWRRTWLWAAAACLVIALVATPLLLPRHQSIAGWEMTAPEFDDYRGISTNMIMKLLERGEYEKALDLTDKALAQSRAEVIKLEAEVDIDEECDYLIDVEMDRQSELLWARAYALVRLDRPEEAAQALDEYLALLGYAPHRENASARVIIL